ncbi:DUF805 domain-containing protein [Plantibacter sp. YIM 135347]|uniref:DUF805 domain-containing protein n=1 Tax=Plantibacter sp. YIM 135347 TaxID=3423919 RepID=UPI003D3536EA
MTEPTPPSAPSPYTTTSMTSTTFGAAISIAFRKYADFSGRANRPEFWWFILFVALVSSALGALNLTTPSGVISIGSSLASVWAIATALPTLAVTVRRLRDTGRAWQNVFWLLVPVAGLIVLAIPLSEPSKPSTLPLSPAS